MLLQPCLLEAAWLHILDYSAYRLNFNPSQGAFTSLKKGPALFSNPITMRSQIFRGHGVTDLVLWHRHTQGDDSES